jgi:hypothetical protein
MTTSHSAQSVISTLTAWWQNRKEANREVEEISSLSAEDLAEVAADCGVSTHDLIAIINAGPHAADELAEMMRALDIDPDAVDRTDRHLFHDMMAACAECGAKGECRYDLRRGRAADRYIHYCPNAEQLDALRTAQTARVE